MMTWKSEKVQCVHQVMPPGVVQCSSFEITSLSPRGRGPESDSQTSVALCVTSVWGNQSMSLNLRNVLTCKMEIQPPFMGLPHN